jgi:hypothetical protein
MPNLKAVPTANDQNFLPGLAFKERVCGPEAAAVEAARRGTGGPHRSPERTSVDRPGGQACAPGLIESRARIVGHTRARPYLPVQSHRPRWPGGTTGQNAGIARGSP